MGNHRRLHHRGSKNLADGRLAGQLRDSAQAAFPALIMRAAG
jgi:hypothetical protein